MTVHAYFTIEVRESIEIELVCGCGASRTSKRRSSLEYGPAIFGKWNMLYYIA